MRKSRDEKDLKRMERAMEKEDANALVSLEGKKKRHVLRKTLGVLVLVLLVGIVGGYYAFDVENWQTLDLNKITNLAQTGSITDMNGVQVSKLQSAQNRVIISINDVPEHVRNAFIAAEDLRFYKHSGFDLIRIFGAVLSNLKTGGYGEGASTITQQLVKLSHLSTEKTIARKLEEIYLALQLEKQVSKEKILEMYLNYIYFGRGAYGIEAAAESYFGVSVKELTVAQAASLAAIIKAPSVYAPHINPEKNAERRSYILKTMYENELIDEQQYAAARAESITPVEPKAEDVRYGWYLDAVLDEAEKLLNFSSEELLGSGYRIYTALDTEQQDIIDTQFANKSAFPSNASDGTLVQGAMASLDVTSGAVRCVAGGRQYTVRRGLNRATQMRRQPGSALKPLAVYAPAIEYHGYTPASVLNDAPTKFGNYSPRNSGYAYYGFVTIRTALKNSLNVPAVALLDKIGVQSARNYLTKVGIELDDRDANLSLALGSMTYGTSPVQLAAAYAPFSNGGYYYEPYFIERIEDAQGNTVFRRSVAGTRVLSETTAYLMTSLLQTVTSSGTGAKLSGAGTPVAGKTGTVNMTSGGNRDIWMAAYNSQISTAFWMGFDQPDNSHKLASRVSGGDNTAAVATAFFRAYYKGRNKPAFKKAGGVVWLEIDKKSVEIAGEAMLASRLTPAAYRYSEVFLSGNHPIKESSVWAAPAKPSAFYVTHNNSGNPVLVITASDAALLRVQRDAVGESIVLTELNAATGETVYFADTKAQLGVEYTYRVIPINQELLNNGVLLEGMQSVQVARARAGSGGLGGTIFRDITSLLFGNSTQEKDTGDQALLMFWNSGD